MLARRGKTFQSPLGVPYPREDHGTIIGRRQRQWVVLRPPLQAQRHRRPTCLERWAHRPVGIRQRLTTPAPRPEARRPGELIGSPTSGYLDHHFPD